MRTLTLNEIFHLHNQLIQTSGGDQGIRDIGGLESAIAQPRMTFDGEDLYPTIVEKAVALGFSIIKNHPFIDGNKRTGYAAMEVFLVLNGFEIDASVNEQETVILETASGEFNRGDLESWVNSHLMKLRTG